MGMKRTGWISVVLLILPSLLPSISASAVVAVNPTPNCSAGSTCTITFSAVGDLYQWNVPAGITSLTVDATGAAGGSGTSPSNSAGGKGARIQAVISVSSGETLKVLAGSRGGNGSSNGGGGGGGGTFLATNSNAALIVAGGGGGGQGNCCSVYQLGRDASVSTSGTQGGSNSGTTQGTAGSNGGGGGRSSSLSSGAGGGFL